MFIFFFFFNDTATTEIYTLSLHDALPIYYSAWAPGTGCPRKGSTATSTSPIRRRSEEHTSELQSQSNLVCRLLLEKKKKQNLFSHTSHEPHPPNLTHRSMHRNSELTHRLL